MVLWVFLSIVANMLRTVAAGSRAQSELQIDWLVGVGEVTRYNSIGRPYVEL